MSFLNQMKLILLLVIFTSRALKDSVAFDVEDCPGECHCTMDGLLMLVDCSGLGLSELPEFPDNQVHMLDLSNNEFTSIPAQLDKFLFLQYLDMTDNKISRLKGDSLKGLVGLRLLNLSKNNISSWTAINPRTLLEPAVSLTELSLAENPLTSFSTNDDNFLLVSDSLRLLDLSHCKITKVTGQHVLQGMKDLKSLHLAGNQIRSVSDLISDSLMTLDLSHNRLTNLLPNMLLQLPSLTYIDLSKNHRISLQTKQGEYVESTSLKRIDLSYCNMDNIELEGFPALMTAILKGNMIHELTKESFINTKMIETLDLSQNSLNSVDANAFKKLKHLKKLNLSFNMIPKIERDTFKENELLTRLDVSRNTIIRFNRIVAPSLTHLNMTWCQIMIIDPDAISGLPELVELDLSNNLINDIPDTLSSENLQTLDLSMNRMVSIRNSTFAGFPEITTIRLSGNRFTIPFRKDYFAENLYLADLELEDNPWLCNCHDMYPFYLYLIEPPAKIWNKQSLRCQSPEEIAGRSWESGCYQTWYPQAQMGTAEKVWTFFMVTIIAFSGCMCLIMSIKRGIEGRRLTRREEERERNLEEGLDIIRQNRMRMQQEAQRDAPDPRESRPPCYSDAILLPRLDGSFASLNELGKNKRRRRRKTEETEEEDIEEEVPLRRNRCRSEEVLSMREVVAASTRSPTISPRIHPLEIEPIDRNLSSNRDEPGDRSSHSTDIVNLDHSPGPSRARSPKVSLQPANGSFEEIRNFNKSSSNTLERSPYAKRKLGHMESFKGERAQKSVPATTSIPETSSHTETSQAQPQTEGIVIQEDYFSPVKATKRHSTTESEDSSEFITINPQKQDSNSSSNEDGLVVIKKPTSI